jgi:hypothetical protein
MLISIGLALFGLAGTAHAQPSGDWVEHRNEKYGFSLKYPSELFKLERTTEAGDGHAFVSADGKARLLVGALQNVAGSTPASYQDHIAQQSYSRFKVSYRPIGKTWFALSGEGNGEIFYEKVIFSCSGRLISSFAIIYSIERRDLFDPLVERMEDSFRAGPSCERAGSTPSAANRRTSADTGPKRMRERVAAPGGRTRVPSAPPQPQDGGSWVMRGRGGLGYVILQRTSPPYETKIVRGQAF